MFPAQLGTLILEVIPLSERKSHSLPSKTHLFSPLPKLRRMRRTGATVIITTRLDAQIVEGVSRIRRMGPSARLYLVTYTPDAEGYQPFVTRLQHHLVEVCYVTPA